jgi:dienelactone hydrolase
MVGKRRRWLVGLLLLAGIGLGATWPWWRDLGLAALLIGELTHPEREGLMARLTDAPAVSRVTFRGSRRAMEALLYAPRSPGSRAAVILVHGVVETGKDDPRLVWAARLLARAGFVVFTPDFLGFKSLTLRTSDIGELVDSFRYLESRRDVVRPDRIGLFGFSYGAGPMLIAAADPAIRDRVRFAISLGGYYDLRNVIRFITTGTYEHGGQAWHLTPHDYPRWIFFRYNLDLLGDARDRRLLAEIAEAKAKDERVDATPLARDLGPEGRAAYEVLTNRDPARVEALLAATGPLLREHLVVLSPARIASDIRARVYLVHSDPDPFIPHTESLKLAEALASSGNARVTLLRIFDHVRPTFPDPTISNMLRVYLPEGTKLLSLIADILSQRR